MGLKSVAPGLFVSDQFKVEMPHPDPCWIFVDSQGVAAATESGKLLVFSTEESLQSFADITHVPTNQLKPTCLSWDEMVDKYRSDYSSTLIDHKGPPGFYQSVPLEKEI